MLNLQPLIRCRCEALLHTRVIFMKMGFFHLFVSKASVVRADDWHSVFEALGRLRMFWQTKKKIKYAQSALVAFQYLLPFQCKAEIRCDVCACHSPRLWAGGRVNFSSRCWKFSVTTCSFLLLFRISVTYFQARGSALPDGLRSKSGAAMEAPMWFLAVAGLFPVVLSFPFLSCPLFLCD